MSERTRVLFAIGSLHAGGSERQMIHILQRLDRARFEPLLYLTYHEGELVDDVPDDVPVFAFWTDRQPPTLNYPGRIHRSQVQHLAETIRLQRPDVVYDRAFSMTLVAGPAANQTQTRRVSCIVANPQLDVPMNARRFLWLKRRALARAYRTADRVVTVSEGVRRAAIAYYHLDSERVTTAYNGIDLDATAKRAAEFAVDWDAKIFNVVACGRLDAAKDYPTLLTAIHDVVRQRDRDSLRLHILGDGPERVRLEGMIDNLDLRDAVTLHGYVPNPLPYVRAANLFCMSSIYEGMPNALMEAIACRVPVLSTDCDFGPREILDDGKCGHLVPTGDPTAFADAICNAIDDYDSWKALTTTAHDHLAATYSASTRIQALESILVGR